jgi:glycosyltransferase involved in cell wall biosynthesis
VTRIAWFSPLPPVRSGIAAYSAELLPQLAASYVIDSYPEHAAHDFVWRMRREPYDLVVYQLGNAPCHDYMWAYLARYPGLVVLHDARLHQARARCLLDQRRFDDYRREFRYDHPDVNPDFAEYAVEGLGGPIYYFWPMVRVVMRTARTVAVHNARVASELRDAFPHVPIETIRMGVPRLAAAGGAGGEIRARLSLPDEAIVFAAFGRVTAEKRVSAMLEALESLDSWPGEGRDTYLMLVGDATDYPLLADEIGRRGLAHRVRLTGHVADDAIAGYLAAADVCLCLRWPTAQETSASWLRCLAAGRPTVITDLGHLADTPSDVAIRVDLVDEAATLLEAMRRLADDQELRRRLGRAGHAYWMAHHTLDAMADDYRRVLALAPSREAPEPDDLPSHFLADYSEPARSILGSFGLDLDQSGGHYPTVRLITR